jgi:hypothetical protein|tara:strand:+ start:2645 stop:3475 length:831 start_codon:yes stop_codon:yes gene_type:complete
MSGGQKSIASFFGGGASSGAAKANADVKKRAVDDVEKGTRASLPVSDLDRPDFGSTSQLSHLPSSNLDRATLTTLPQHAPSLPAPIAAQKSPPGQTENVPPATKKPRLKRKSEREDPKAESAPLAPTAEPMDEKLAEPEPVPEVEPVPELKAPTPTPKAPPKPVVISKKETAARDEMDADYDDDDADDDDDIEDEEHGPPADGLAKVMAGGAKQQTKKTKTVKRDVKIDPNGVGGGAVEAAGRLLQYDPKSALCWETGTPAPYLVRAFPTHHIPPP